MKKKDTTFHKIIPLFFRISVPLKNTVLFLLLLVLSVTGFASEALSPAGMDTSGMVILLKKAEKLNPDSAILLLDSLENLFPAHSSSVLLARINFCKGEMLMQKEEPIRADSSYHEAYRILSGQPADTQYLSLLKKLAVSAYYMGDNMEMYGFALTGLRIARKLQDEEKEGIFSNLLGIAMDGLGNKADALIYYQKALKIFNHLKDIKRVSSVEMNLGVLSQELKDIESAKRYYENALMSAEKARDTSILTALYLNLANIYSDENNFSKALEYSFKSLELSRKAKDENTEALNLNNIGDTYQKMNQLDKAYQYYQKALRLSEKIYDVRSMSAAMISLSELYAVKNKVDSALYYANRGWQLLKKGGDVYYRLYALKQLEKLYARKRNFKKAYQMLQQYVMIHDSVYSSKNRSRLDRVKMQYLLKVKNQTLRLARERQKLFRAYLFASLFALLLVIGGGIFLFRIRTLRSRELKKRMAFVDSLLEYSESFVLMLDSNLKISYLSPSYQKTFGHYLKERKGGDPFDFVHPDEVEQLRALLNDFFTGKRKRLEFSFRLKKSTGEYRYMQGVFNNRLDNPDLNGYVLNFWDVTELRKTQQAISESERKYYDIFNAFPDIYFRIDNQGKVVEISPSVKSVAGYEREEVLGKSLYDFVEIDREWPRISKILQRIQHVKDYSLTLRTKHGKQIYCSLNIHELKDSDRNLSGYEGVLRDITDRVLAEKRLRQSENQLKEANASKDKLLSIIGHDLLGPIGTQKSILDMVIDDVEDFSREEILSLLKTMKPSLDATYTMIENLLSWARIMRKSITPRLMPDDITIIVRKSFDLLAQQAARKNIKLVYEGEKEAKALFDKNMLEIVVRNLLSNAIKFSHPDSKITVTVSKGTGEIVVSISDEGTGLTKEQIEKILKEKEKMESRPGTQKEKGTGLGLVVVKEFIQLNNGKLFIESEPGKGTTFSFTLPLA